MKFRRMMYVFVLVMALAGVLAACNPAPQPTTYYEIKFYEADGVNLLSTVRVKEGDPIVYDGYDPQTPTELGYAFTFAGWSEQKNGSPMTGMVARKNTKLYAVFTKTAVQKTAVTIPQADTTSFVWNNAVQVYAIATSPDYFVFGNEQMNAGEYTVEVILKNTDTHCWADGSIEPLRYSFVIAQAQNAWTSEPSILDWEVGTDASVPTGASTYGEVTFTYSTSENGTYTATVPTAAGSYFVKATVAGTDNYTGLTVVKPFVIDKNTYTVTFKKADGTVIDTVEVRKGAEVSYDASGIVPESTVSTLYTFAGWSETANGTVIERPVADGEKTLYAVIASAPRTYKIVFEDVDGKILDEQEVAYGETVTYKGKTPIPPAESIVTYIFLAWKQKGTDVNLDTLPTVTGDMTFVAEYEIAFSNLYGDSESNPYPITTARELMFLSEMLDTKDFSGKFFRLDADITLSDGIGFGMQKGFAGIFDGNGKKITLETQNAQNAALFAVNNGTIKNFTVVANILATEKAAGIVVENNGTVSGCRVSGSVSGKTVAGAIVASNASGATVQSCEADALVSLGGAYYADVVGTASSKLGLLVGENNGTLTLAPSVWNGSDVATAFASGAGTAQSPYVIATAAELAYFKDGAGANSYWEGKYFVLANSIDLAGHAWSGVGTGASANGFKGHLDGAGHTVYNFTPASISANNKAFFNSISSGATVKNLTVHGSIANVASGRSYFALVAAISKANLFQNVRAIGSVTGSAKFTALAVAWHEGGNLENVSAFGKASGAITVGGVIAYNKSTSTQCGSLLNCKNYASLSIGDFAHTTADSGFGGIVGCIGTAGLIDGCVNYGTLTGSAGANGGTAGIVGNIYVSTVQNCVNYGTIYSANIAGGIAGFQRNGSVVQDCVNYGTVSTTTQQVGGITGYLGNNNGTASIFRCTNNGTVSTATHTAAGIAGHGARAIVEDCVNNGSISGGAGSYWIAGIVGMMGSDGSITGCENNGAITGDGTMSGSYAGVGGIVGSNYASTVTDCTNNASVTGVCYVGGIVGYAQSADGSVTNCDNLAQGTVTATIADTAAACGGIIGYNNGAVSGCENYGTVSATTTAEVPMVGGIIGYDNSTEGKVSGDNVDHTA